MTSDSLLICDFNSGIHIFFIQYKSLLFSRNLKKILVLFAEHDRPTYYAKKDLLNNVMIIDLLLLK